ncbi:MAG: AAA family ATPase [Pseudomonadota bacterium]|nr:AAA family ATPase [Pseudomonadota bacterium]
MSIFDPENSILKILMLDGASYWQVCESICPDDFSPKGRKLFEAIATEIREGRPCDSVTLADKLGDDLGMYAYDIASNTPGQVGNVAVYAKMLSEAGEAKRVREAGQRIAVCGSYSDAQALLAQVRPMQSARMKTAEVGLGEMLVSMKARFAAESVVTGTPTGLASLDEITGGWQEGDLIGLGGSTSMGKTAFALQSALASGRCYYASLEMMASQLYERVVSNIGHVPYRYIRFPREAPDEFVQSGGLLYQAIAKAKVLPLIVDDQPGLTVEQISARARQLHMVEPLKLIVVDHLNLIKRPRKNGASELGEIAIALKNLAKDLRVPVMVLVQLNRDSKKHEDKRPELEAFRDSGEIEEALDTAVMVYRDEYHNTEGPLKGYAEFIVRKQRQGERNVTAWAKSYLSQMRFETTDAPERPAANVSGDDGNRSFKARFGARNQPQQISVAGRYD